MFFLNHGPICWRSALLKNITVSTAEAEYYGMSMAARAGIPLITVVRDLGGTDLLLITPRIRTSSLNAKLYVLRDNKAAIALT